MQYKASIVVIILTFIVFINNGCKCSHNSDDDVITTDIDTSSIIVKYEDSLFPIPSSWETSKKIKEYNLPFNSSLLAKNKIEEYTTSFKQALNLGVLSSDISYLNMYNEIQLSIDFLSSIKQLCIELNIDQIFDNTIFNSIECNINKRDSITSIITDTYRKSDKYLKANDRSEIGALIITGAWIESMYLLSQMAIQTQNRDLINRIGEQKFPLNNLIELLTPYYYKSEVFATFIDGFIELSNDFDGIIYNYNYRKPTIIPEQKLIIINSQSRIVISEFHIQTIAKKIELIRNGIVE